MEIDRKRGRPSGKNRTPLSLSEKRARNAHYERERRVQCNKAYEELAQVLGCPPQTSNQVILQTASEYITNTPSVEALKHTNEKLACEIQEIEQIQYAVATTSKCAQAITPPPSTSEPDEEVKQVTETNTKKKKTKGGKQKPRKAKSMQTGTKSLNLGHVVSAPVCPSQSPPQSPPSAPPSPLPAPNSVLPAWLSIPLPLLEPTSTPAMSVSSPLSEADDCIKLDLSDTEWSDAYKIFPDLAVMMP